MSQEWLFLIRSKNRLVQIKITKFPIEEKKAIDQELLVLTRITFESLEADTDDKSTWKLYCE